MVGVALSILIVLNIRNGLGLANIDQNTQTGVIGVLLILSVLVPNLVARFAGPWRATRPASVAPPPREREVIPPNPRAGPASDATLIDWRRRWMNRMGRGRGGGIAWILAAVMVALIARGRRPRRRRRDRAGEPRRATATAEAAAGRERPGEVRAGQEFKSSSSRSRPASPCSTRPTRAPRRRRASSVDEAEFLGPASPTRASPGRSTPSPTPRRRASTR